jgi:hypothetical protein
MGLSLEYRNRALTWVMRPATSVTRPSSLHLALFSSVTGPETGTEVSGSGYARAVITSAFGAPSGGATTNAATASFATGPSGGDWTVAGVAIYDAASGGNLVTEIEEYDTPIVIDDGDAAPGFDVGDLIVALAPCL